MRALAALLLLVSLAACGSAPEGELDAAVVDARPDAAQICEPFDPNCDVPHPPYPPIDVLWDVVIDDGWDAELDPGPVVLVPGGVVVLSSHFAYRVDDDGTDVLRVPVPPTLVFHAVLDGDQLVAGYDTTLVGFDTTTLAIRWQVPIAGRYVTALGRGPAGYDVLLTDGSSGDSLIRIGRDGVVIDDRSLLARAGIVGLTIHGDDDLIRGVGVRGRVCQRSMIDAADATVAEGAALFDDRVFSCRGVQLGDRFAAVGAHGTPEGNRFAVVELDSDGAPAGTGVLTGAPAGDSHGRLGNDYVTLGGQVVGFVPVDDPSHDEWRRLPVPDGYGFYRSALGGDGERAFAVMTLGTGGVHLVRLKPR